MTLTRVLLADSHVHLDRYRSAVVDRLLARARRTGVRRFLAVGVDRATSLAVLELAQRRRGVRAAVGVHPTRVDGQNPTVDLTWLRLLADEPAVAAIGEVGLDATGSASLGAQLACFEACLALAAERELTLVLHAVGWHERVLAALAGWPQVRTVVHYFQGDAELARRYLEAGCWISVGKPVTRAERAELRAAIRQVPLERLLLETDTYPLAGRATEPRDVAEIGRAVAELHDVELERVAAATSASYRRLFERRRQPSGQRKRRPRPDQGAGFDFLVQS